MPEVGWADLTSQTTEMSAVLATAQTLLAKDEAMAAAAQTAEQEDATDEKGKRETGDAQRQRSAEGTTSKQNLRVRSAHLARKRLIR
jgi:hypothetical protein